MGHCEVKFFWLSPYGSYDVLATDYESYAIVYSCSTYFANAYCLEWLWILSRDQYDTDSAEYVAFNTQMLAIIK